VLKRIWRADRPWKGFGQVGEGYGMPSSHTQAAAFLVAWGIGYALTSGRRYTGNAVVERLALVQSIRSYIWVFALVLWSLLVAYSRCVLFASAIRFGPTEQMAPALPLPTPDRRRIHRRSASRVRLLRLDRVPPPLSSGINPRSITRPGRISVAGCRRCWRVAVRRR
jgi:hypothetical protein